MWNKSLQSKEERLNNIYTWVTKLVLMPWKNLAGESLGMGPVGLGTCCDDAMGLKFLGIGFRLGIF